MNFYWDDILVHENLENGIYIETIYGRYIVTQEELDSAHNHIL